MTKNTFISRLLSFLSPRPCPICGLRIEAGPSVICASCDMRLPRTGYAATLMKIRWLSYIGAEYLLRRRLPLCFIMLAMMRATSSTI